MRRHASWRPRFGAPARRSGLGPGDRWQAESSPWTWPTSPCVAICHVYGLRGRLAVPGRAGEEPQTAALRRG